MRIKTNKTCSVCGSEYYAKDLCKFHYDRKRNCRDLRMKPSVKKNEYCIVDDYAEVTFYDKKHEKVGNFYVDASMIEKIKDIKWSVISTGYIAGYPKGKMILLHRFVTNCPDEMVVDHLNHNKLDNRLSNLRICTQKENMENGRYQVGKSGVKGIAKTKSGYFIANKKGKYIGCSKNLETAKQYLLEREENL